MRGRYCHSFGGDRSKSRSRLSREPTAARGLRRASLSGLGGSDNVIGRWESGHEWPDVLQCLNIGGAKGQFKKWREER
jgi:hypothetical protein